MEGEAFKIHIVHILFLVISSFYTYTIQREDGMEGDVFKIQIAHLLSWFYQAIYRCTRRGYEEGKSFWNPSSTFTFSCCYMVFIAIIMMVGVIMMLTTSIKCPSLAKKLPRHHFYVWWQHFRSLTASASSATLSSSADPSWMRRTGIRYCKIYSYLVKYTWISGISTNLFKYRVYSNILISVLKHGIHI